MIIKRLFINKIIYNWLIIINCNLSSVFYYYSYYFVIRLENYSTSTNKLRILLPTVEYSKTILSAKITWYYNYNFHFRQVYFILNTNINEYKMHKNSSCYKHILLSVKRVRNIMFLTVKIQYQYSIELLWFLVENMINLWWM